MRFSTFGHLDSFIAGANPQGAPLIGTTPLDLEINGR